MKKITESFKSRSMSLYNFNIKNYSNDKTKFFINFYENAYITNKPIKLNRKNLVLSFGMSEDIQKLVRLENLVDDYYDLNIKFKDDDQKYIYFNEKGVYTGRIDLNYEFNAYDVVSLNARVLFYFIYVFKSVYNKNISKIEIFRFKNKNIITLENYDSKKVKNMLYLII